MRLLARNLTSCSGVRRPCVGVIAVALVVGCRASDLVQVPPGGQLQFSVQPSRTQAGASISPPVQVTVLNELGEPEASFTSPVTVTLGANPGGAELLGETTAAVQNGIATFANLRLSAPGSGYVLRAIAPARQTAASAAFDVTAPPPPPPQATRLAFTGQPSMTDAGDVIDPPVRVAARDGDGNTITSYSGTISIGLAANPSGGVLTGATAVAAVNGIATFADLRIDRAGAGYSLSASATGLSGATSSAFTVTEPPPPPATRLVFSVEPSPTLAGQAITPAIQVTAQDAAGGIATTYDGTITITIATNPTGGVLGGTRSVAAVGGVASFSDLQIDRAGAGYRLSAAATALTGATSAAFDVTAPPAQATKLAFTVEPGATMTGDAIAPPVQVTAQDASGATATTYSGTITVTIGANPVGGSLSGTTAAVASAGVATFADLRIDKAGVGYRLAAGAAGLTGAASAPFTVSDAPPPPPPPPPPATQLAFAVQPATVQQGQTITPAVQVVARDASGGTATAFNGTITIAIAANPSGGTLAGTTAAAAVNGVATFGDLRISASGDGYTLAAGASGLSGATSAPFHVTPPPPEPPTRLAFLVQPSTTQAGSVIAPPIAVAAQDAAGNTVTGYSGTITLAIATNPTGGVMTGTTAVVATNGVATFGDVRIDQAGAGYRLAAGAAGLTGVTSSAFDVTAPPATRLAFTVQPTTATAGTAIAPAVQVAAQDAAGNTVTDFTGTITIAIGNNPSAGTLSGATSVAAVNGVASFSGLQIDVAGAGYTLTAATSGLAAATSAGFDITAGAATRLEFSVQPTSTTAGQDIQPDVAVTARDALGNRATGFAEDVTIAIGTNPASAQLSGGTTRRAVAGIAVFPGLHIDMAGDGYTLTAAASGLSGAVSAPFNIAP
jgi:hypothetical protein